MNVPALHIMWSDLVMHVYECERVSPGAAAFALSLCLCVSVSLSVTLRLCLSHRISPSAAIFAGRRDIAAGWLD